MVDIGKSNPVDFLLRPELLPTIWCSGCGIGIVVNSFVQAVEKIRGDSKEVRVLSTGIGCTGKISDYLDVESCCITTGDEVVNWVAKLTSESPDTRVVLFLDDADFLTSGVEPFIQAGERGAELLIIYINNCIYRLVMEHRVSEKTSANEHSAGRHFESPFNIPNLAKACGARHIARWTPLHPRRLMNSITDGLQKRGFSVVEVFSPCLMTFPSIGKIGETIDRMGFYSENSVIKHNEPTENLDIRSQQRIIVGEFGCRSF